MSISEIGCCGAYCRTCSAFIEQVCKGCKVGYDAFLAVADKWKNAYGKYE